MAPGVEILVVDDDVSMLSLLKQYLNAEGYEVLSARDGEEALRLIALKKVRVVITDWMMPGMGGMDLCRAIRSSEDTEPIYIIVLTGSDDASALVKAFNAGADDFLSKPFNRQELMVRLGAGMRILRLEERLTRQMSVAQERDTLREAVSSMERVLGVVSHELRTPLAGARAMTEFLLQHDAREAKELNEFLHSIHREVVNMANTVNDLLEVARMNNGAVQWTWSQFAVADACGSALQAIEPLVDREEVGLSLEVTPSTLTMHGDAGAIRRLLINLLSNAQQHTHSGSIRVRAHTVMKDGMDWVHLEVSDSGEGIAPHTAEQLGVAFAVNSGALGDRHIRGSGLGLSICRGIVAAHGGEIHVRSKEGVGTTVSALLRADLRCAAATDNLAAILTEAVS